MPKNKKPKQKFYDDGRTVSNMNVQGMPWYEPEEVRKNRESIKQDAPTRKERWAMIRARFAATFPFFMCILCAFGFTFLLLWLWLR